MFYHWFTEFDHIKKNFISPLLNLQLFIFYYVFVVEIHKLIKRKV